MDNLVLAMVIGAAVFILPVVFMLGWAWREKQHGETVKKCEENVSYQRKVLIEMHNEDIAKERNTVRELEISLLQAGESIELGHQEILKLTKRWEYADKYRAAIVEVVFGRNLWNFKEHADDPYLMLQALIDDAAKNAVDPTVNQKAKNLFIRGVRKGAKQGREQMRKLMQKSIDNQAATIRHYDKELTDANVRRMRFTEALTNVLNDKIALPGVRRSLNQAIIIEHARLREVAEKKGM